MSNDQNWLRAEQDGDDVLAEAMFARVIAAMPPIEPGADFVSRTVDAAWRARTHRRFAAFARIAAMFALMIGVPAAIYAFSGWAIALIVPGTVALSRGLMWLVTSAGDGVGWWWIADRIGGAVADTVGEPFTASAVAAGALIALAAIYAFQYLVHDTFAAPESRKVRT